MANATVALRSLIHSCHPGKEAIDAFAARFDKLTHTKSALHLPHSEPMPWELLREMVEFCVRERRKSANQNGLYRMG